MSSRLSLRPVLLGTAALAALVAAGVFAGPAYAQGIDVVFKIDESGSMGDDIADIQNNVGLIFGALPGGSHVGLVGYGTHLHGFQPNNNNDQIPHLHTPLTSDQTTFQNAVNDLIASGGLEEGYRVVYESATDTIEVDWQGAVTFPSLEFTGAPYCNILITDETLDQQFSAGSRTLQEAIDAMLAFDEGQGGIFFGILPSGLFSTAQPIADATGGTLFDLGAFRADAQPVIDAVLAACVEAALPVKIDIKPNSCPNPYLLKTRGVTPVAILGTEDFDVNDVDPATVELEGCPAVRWAYEDVTTPFDGDFGDPLDEMACVELVYDDAGNIVSGGPDGYLDLVLKFKRSCLTAAQTELGVQLWTATGEYWNGSDWVEFETQDVVRVME